jgi:hypothetical protein
MNHSWFYLIYYALKHIFRKKVNIFYDISDKILIKELDKYKNKHIMIIFYTYVYIT